MADSWYTEDFEATYLDVVEDCEGLLKQIIFLVCCSGDLAESNCPVENGRK